MIIDVHFHIGEIAHYNIDGWIAPLDHAGFMGGIQESYSMLKTPESEFKSRRYPNPLAVDVDRLIERMDQSGVDKTVVVALDVKRWKTKVPNEYVAEKVRKYPNRLIGLASVDPIGGENSVRELYHAVRDLGLSGLKLLPSYDLIAPNDDRIFPLYEAAVDLDIPVQIHTGWSLGGMMKHETPLLIDEIAIRYPKLRIQMLHAGYQWAYLTPMVMLKHPNVWADISWWHAWPLDNLVRLLGLCKHFAVLNKLMWGTDNFDHKADIDRIRKVPAQAKQLNIAPGLPEITNDDVRLLLGENAARFYNMRA